MVPIASIETGQGGLGDGAIQAPKPRPLTFFYLVPLKRSLFS